MDAPLAKYHAESLWLFLFMAHGSAKLFGMPAAQPTEPVSWQSLMGVAGMVELFGGFLLVLGVFTRPVAFILAGQMAVAYFHVACAAGVLAPSVSG